MSVQISYKKQFVFFFMLLIVLLVVVEIPIRIFEYIEDPCIDWRKESQVFENYDPKITKQVCLDLHAKPERYDVIRLEPPNHHSPTLNINSEGFRGPEIFKDKPNGVYRIFVIGGSTTFGVGATSDETTISGFLQKNFDEYNLNFRVEVINAGIEAAYSSTEAYYIKNTLLEFEPDLIIVYGGWNDSSDVSIVERINTTDFDIRQLLFYRTPWFIYERIIGYPDREEVFSNQNEDFFPKRVDVWKNNWLDICKLSKESKFKTIVTVQPIVGTGNKILTSYESSLIQNQPIEHNFGITGLNEFVKVLNELERECYATADLRSVFDGISEPIYFDLGHMSDFGNKLVAQKLFELSLPIVLEK